MCPYYHENLKICKIYKTVPTSYNLDTYCLEKTKSHTQCPNYEACKRSYGGSMPPPYKF